MGVSSPYKPSRLISPLKARKLQRALKNVKLTVICGLLTVLVLRGALGAGKFGTPAKDFEEIKYQFERVQGLHVRKQASRVLAEIIEERQYRPQDTIETQAQYVISYDVSEVVKVQRNSDVHNISDVHDKHALHNYNNSDVNYTSDLTKPNDALSPIKPSDLTKPNDALSPIKPSDQDAQRQDWLPKSSNSVRRKPPTMLITGYHPSACENPSGDYYLLKFITNKVEYCNLHGIKILYNSAILNAEMSGLSAQFRLLQKLMLTHPEVEWFWWMASDSMFADMAFELHMENYKDYHLMLHGWNEMIHQKEGWIGLTTGSFLIRNSQWSLTVLDEAGKLLDESLAGGVHDWPAIARLIMNNKKIQEEVLPSEALIYPHGYWKELANQSEGHEAGKKRDIVNAMPESRPFVTSFAGCKVCRKGDQNADRCRKQMEKAFDSADGQILKLGGLQITASSTSALRRLRGPGHKSNIVVPHPGVVHSLPHQGSTT